MDEIKDTSKPALSEAVNGIVWKILVEEEQHLIAVESRDADNKQVYFSVFNYETGQTFFKNVMLHERWNLTIAHLNRDVLIIKMFPSEGNPVSKGILAVSCQTGHVIWERHNIAFQQVWKEGLEVTNPQLLARKPFLLNIRTGDEKSAEQRTALESPILFPQAAAPSVVAQYVSNTVISGPVMYAEANGKSIAAFHEHSEEKLRLRLVVFQELTTFIDTILQNDIQKLHPETFFLLQNHLFCIRGNNTIISYLV